MRMCSIVMALSLICSATAVRADVLAGVMFGSSGQAEAVCYLFNAGPGAVNITAKSISDENAEVSLKGNSCGASLAQGKTCFFAAWILDGRAHACRAILPPSGANVRGTFDVRDSSSNVLGQVELR